VPFAVVLSAFGQETNIFSIYCSTGELLLDFLNVITPANLLLAFFTDRWTSRDSACDVTLAERPAGAYWSSRRKEEEENKRRRERESAHCHMHCV